MEQRIPLEQAAVDLCKAASVPPLIFQLPPAEGRKMLDMAQNTPVEQSPAHIYETMVDTGPWGTISLYQVCPEHPAKHPGIILYIHGAGWVFGNFHTHEKLVRELAARTGCIVLFPEYSLSPEAKYPTAIEQCYAVLTQMPQMARQMGWDMDTLTVAGDSVGGNMAVALTFLTRERKGPKIHKQLLYYPVTNAAFNTESYLKFAVGYYLYRAGMMWFWDQYTTSETDRNEITASPLRATLDQLKGLPPACIVTDEADVLRDEGEAYAAKLLQAGVEVTSVRVRAIVHDFVMLHSLDQTNACRIAMDLSTAWINRENEQRKTIK